MKKYLVAVIAILVLFTILGFLPDAPKGKTQNVYKTTTVTLGSTQINADVADTNALRVLGLSGRSRLDENSGMIFVFDNADFHGFWMRDMKFSIDMVWANGDKIVFIAKSVSPTTFPKIFKPTSPARFVVELPAGFCDTHNLSVGDFFSTGL